MKKLHLVGLTPDNGGLLLSVRKGSKTGGYVVTLDEETLASIERARRRAEGGEPGDETDAAGAAPPARARARSSLTPREIQARLRAGSTIAEVAGAAGVDEEWVQRFAAPILAEQAQVVERAQSMTFAKARLGPSIEPLAASVQWNLSDRGVRFSDDVFADCWSAYNLHGARWAVRFSYFTRKRHQVAEWEVDLRDQRITARNRLAADLAHVEAGRRPPEPESTEPNGMAAPPVVSPPATSKAPAKATPAKAAAKRASGKRAAGRPALARAAEPVAPDVAAVAASPPKRAAKRAGKAAVRATTAKADARTTRGRGVGKAAARALAAPAAPDPTTPSPGEPAAAVRVPKKAPVRGAAGGAKASAPRKAAVRTAPRESSPRKGRAAKKPPADAPGGTPAADPADERPSHLARPPSPMKTANRVTSTPVPRYARPSPPRPRATPPPAPSRTTPPGPEPIAVPEPPPAPADLAREPSPAEPAAPAPKATPPARAAATGEAATTGKAATSGKAAASPPDTAATPPAEGRLITVPASRPPAVKAAKGAKSPRTPPVAPPIRRAPTDEPVVAATDADGPAVVILPTPRPGAAPPRGRGATAAAPPPASAFEDGDDDAAWSSFVSPEGPAGAGASSGRGSVRRPRR